MNYRKMEEFLSGSRIWGTVEVFLLLASGAYCVAALYYLSATRMAIAYVLVLVSLAASLYYTPDYLHLSLDQEKAAKWAVKVRWRIVAGIALLGLIFASTTQGRMAAVIAAVALLLANLVAARTSRKYLPMLFGVTDAVILLGVSRFIEVHTVWIGLIAAAIAHFSLVIMRDGEHPRWWFFLVFVVGLLSIRSQPGWELAKWASAAVFMIAAMGTQAMRRRVGIQHESDRKDALDELVAFSGKSPAEVEELWRDSNRQLAENWKAACLNEDDHAAVKEWYRQNSGLYLYAISGHNLEYKKIIANVRMLRFAKGHCLDYGAGNGEMILELAQRGHAATYYDVDGETLRFARWRAERRNLKINFATTKDQIARELGTIYSFDVLEHVPDLEGELTFLASLLAPGGLLLCDVPAGATKNHPMHLNHRLNVAEFLRGKGLADKRTLLQRLTSSEKYIFQA